MAKRKTSTDTEMSFEDALEHVEGIIERIESGEVGLEASIDEYERGIGLLRRCRSILDRAEARVQTLNDADLDTPGSGEADESREGSGESSSGGG